MKRLSKDIRLLVWEKYGKKCAYCGVDLEYKKMQVDHIEPKFRGSTDEEVKNYNRTKGEDGLSNLNPSCARCNRWKSTYTLEQFREEISKQCERLKRDSNQYRMAMDYGLIKETSKDVLFFFERFQDIY
jgi:5-methylcytosine-specific restriction endonuclease McrA